MSKKFIFDVDGTLTPARKVIDSEFSEFFLGFCKRHKVYLVTGSDKQKTIDQIGFELYNSVQIVFNCAGNEAWKGNIPIYWNNWKPEQKVLDYLHDILNKSAFSERSGNHIEFRTGMINFSIVGRQCTDLQRELYIQWDKETKERVSISLDIKSNFDDIDVYIGGDTGIDIFNKGHGKSQVEKYIRTSSSDVLYYYGDQIFSGGNDYEIAKLCDHNIQVDSWLDTYHSILTLENII